MRRAVPEMKCGGGFVDNRELLADEVRKGFADEVRKGFEVSGVQHPQQRNNWGVGESGPQWRTGEGTAQTSLRLLPELPATP